MKQILREFKPLHFLVLVLSVLASFASGGMAMAAVGLDDVGRTTADPDGTGAAVKNDPNAGTPLEGSTPDSPQKGLDQQSAAATGSALDQAGVTENNIDDYVSKFRAYRFPLHTDILRKARQIKVDTKEPTNWEVGEAVMEFTSIAKVTGGEEEVTLTAT